MRNARSQEPKERPSEEERARILEILRSNQGFSEPEKWVDYALEHSFKKVRAEKLQKCPECGSQCFTTLGQYVYFSTLSQLQKCRSCGLVFSDSKIDPDEVRTYFEKSYKEEIYFRVWRRRIVEQIARLVDRLSPLGGRVLDIGGATGYQMEVVRRRRPDLDITISDLSASSCAAASRYGFKTICGRMSSLETIEERFDVVVICDVIYYEQDLAGIWRILPKVIANGGSLVIRAPNTLVLMDLAQLALRLFRSRRSLKFSDRIPFFTPDHFYVFSRRFLTDRLRKIGFGLVGTFPSELLAPDWKSNYLNASFYYLTRAIHTFTFGHVILTPSLLYVSSLWSPESAKRSSGP